ncbi:MAG: LysR family transcriptional regulator [Gammaproteobacteria bacterium]|nr:LysR family transcriptional regulator [Gammaproteobacteria bacterium]MBU1444542.1 LysR family transcriptional regulator [Gammaproteobacteria bacterium]MBU2287332.1 LysR family transcriptional regulator [Gammaproteobacteria bacterium]MBU2408332.1 LysR family transcriptional regulator [Gammaproteobacteria bacterium]
MDLRDLRYFEVIAELEHLGRASERLHRTQPALTSCVRRLEEACGAALFEKTGRGIRLTTAGKALLKWAQRTRFDVESARREIGDIGRGLSGNVSIGIVPTAAQFLLPPATRELLSEAPAITLRTTVALVDVLAPLLRAGDIDLMVGTEGSKEPGFTSQFLAEDLIVVAANSTHEVFDKPKPALRDLVGCRWVLQPPGAPTRDWLDQTFDRYRLPRPVVQVESTMLLMLPSLIAETGLLSFISRLHLQEGRSGAALREVKVKDTVMRRRMVVTCREGGYMSPAAQRLIDILARHAGVTLG